MHEDDVLAELKALREADRGLRASAEVEARVIKAFRRRTVRRTFRRSSEVLAAAAAIAGVMLLPRTGQRPTTIPAQQLVATAAPAAVEETPAATAAAPAPRSKRTPKKIQPAEIATEFFPLMDTPPPFERGAIMRVVVPAATMRNIGLPVREEHLNDPVQADILVGQEGLARAIRFVDYRQ